MGEDNVWYMILLFDNFVDVFKFIYYSCENNFDSNFELLFKYKKLFIKKV